MSEKTYPIACILILFLWSSGEALGQFVKLRLEIPAGVNFDSKIIEQNPQGSDQQMIWMEIVANENLTILFDLRQEDTGKSHEVFFLNDGTVNFSNAGKLPSGSQRLQLHNSGLLIRNIKPMTNRIHAWLGLPVAGGLIGRIEYP